MLHTLTQHFKEGGWGMWPLVLLLVVTLLVFVERSWVVFRERSAPAAFLRAVRALVLGRAPDRAISFCIERPSAVSRMTLAALLVADRPEPEVRAALQQAALIERPRLERRTACFASFANVAMWTGLLGTLTGLAPGCFGIGCVSGFPGGPTIDPARRAELLAGAMSEALNCTAGGLLVALVALVCFALVNGRTQRLLGDLDEAAAGVAHVLEIRRSARRVPPPYRSPPPE